MTKRKNAKNVELPIGFNSPSDMDDLIAAILPTIEFSASPATSSTTATSIARRGIKVEDHYPYRVSYAVKCLPPLSVAAAFARISVQVSSAI